MMPGEFNPAEVTSGPEMQKLALADTLRQITNYYSQPPDQKILRKLTAQFNENTAGFTELLKPGDENKQALLNMEKAYLIAKVNYRNNEPSYPLFRSIRETVISNLDQISTNINQTEDQKELEYKFEFLRNFIYGSGGFLDHEYLSKIADIFLENSEKATDIDVRTLNLMSLLDSYDSSLWQKIRPAIINMIYCSNQDPLKDKKISSGLYLIDSLTYRHPNHKQAARTEFEYYCRLQLESIGLDSDKVLHEWNQVHGGKETNRNFEQLVLLERELPGAARALYQEFGISNFGRYTLNMLKDIYLKRDDQELPYGIMILPKDDPNGAFHHYTEILGNFYSEFEGKYNVRLYEVGGKLEFVKAIVKAHRRYGANQKISFAIIGGHGTPGSIRFGPEKSNAKNDPGKLDKEDLTRIGAKTIAETAFAQNPTVFLFSCSTGEVNGIGQMMSGLGAKVIAPEEPMALRRIEPVFTDNGVDFKVAFFGSPISLYSSGVKDPTS